MKQKMIYLQISFNSTFLKVLPILHKTECTKNKQNRTFESKIAFETGALSGNSIQFCHRIGKSHVLAHKSHENLSSGVKNAETEEKHTENQKKIKFTCKTQLNIELISFFICSEIREYFRRNLLRKCSKSQKIN